MSTRTRSSSLSANKKNEPNLGQQALRLLDQRRIRRQAIVRDFDLVPDDDNGGDDDDEKKDSPLRPTSSSPLSSSRSSPTTKKTTTVNQQDSKADFRIFGRLIPPGVYRDRTRQYLLTDFENMTAEVEDQVGGSSKNNGNKKNDSSKKTLPTSDLVLNKRKAEEERKAAETTDSFAVLTLQSGMKKRPNRRKLFEKFVNEAKLHRKLFDAAVGELSADLANPGSAAGILAESAAADGRFRKLVRSCDPEVVEELQRELVEARQKLPLSITATTMYVRGAFPDRPPSPRTLSLQRRRIRLAEMLKSTSDYENSFLKMSANPVTMFWHLNYLLKGATLTPRSSFFSSSSAAVGTLKRKSSMRNVSAGDGASTLSRTNSATTTTLSLALNVSQTDESHAKLTTTTTLKDAKKNNKTSAPSLIISISPQRLAENLRGVLPWSALTDNDVDWLMNFFAPEYQQVIARNKEAVKKAKNPSLLVSLARTRRDQSGIESLDSDLRKKLRAYEEECKIIKPPNEPIDFEAGVKRLMRGLNDALQLRQRQQDHQKNKKDTTSQQQNQASSILPLKDVPSIALLCYSSLLPRALRNSKAVIGANASSPPPAITKEWLSLSEAEYSAVGEDEMASLVSRFACTWHAHFVHISSGVDVNTLVLETKEDTSRTIIRHHLKKNDDENQEQGKHEADQKKDSGSARKESPSRGNNSTRSQSPSSSRSTSTKKKNSKKSKEPTSTRIITKRNIVQRDHPSMFSPEMQECIGNGLEECPVCTLTSMVDSNYSYLDSNILNHLRNEARGDLIEEFEKQILKNLWRNTSSQSQSQQRQQQHEHEQRVIGELVNWRNNLTPLEEVEVENLERDRKRKRRSPQSKDGENDDDDGEIDHQDQDHNSKVEIQNSSKEKAEQILVNKNWRYDLIEFAEDLEDFKIQKVITKRKNVPATTVEDEEKEKNHDFDEGTETAFSLTTVNNRYFDCFVTHLAQSPAFASLMSGLMLKQIVMMAGGGGGSSTTTTKKK